MRQNMNTRMTPYQSSVHKRTLTWLSSPSSAHWSPHPTFPGVDRKTKENNEMKTFITSNKCTADKYSP